MSFSDIASLGSLISGVAVLISLVYLALQVRQAEKNQRAALNQGTVDRLANLILTLSQPAFADLLARVRAPDPTFTAQEIMSLRLIQRATLLSLQDTVIQHREGLLDQATLDNGVNAMKETLAWPVARVIWQSTKHSYAPELRTFVEGLMAGLPVPTPRDIDAEFKLALAHVSYSAAANSDRVQPFG